MQIRRATDRDVTELADLYIAVARFHAEGEPDRLELPSGEKAGLLPGIRTRTTDESWAVFIAVDEQKIVGFLDICEETEPAGRVRPARRFARIPNLFVIESHRKRGVASQLLDSAETWSNDRGLPEVELEVWEFAQDARRLYEIRGYRTISRRLARPI